MRFQGVIFCVLLAGMLMLSGCTAGKQAKAAGEPAAGTPPVTQEQLLHHAYVLHEFDGKKFASKQRPTLEFNEGFRISGAMCNRFMGQATLEGNVLKAKSMAMTRMLCTDDVLNELEMRFAEMLAAGAMVELQGDTLTLRGKNTVLVFTLLDYI